MTTWDNGDITEVHRTYLGSGKMFTYTITGVSGDTGGTLTCRGFKAIKNTFVSAYTSSAVCASLTWRISSNTVVVAYTNPTATHTIRITAIGK